MEIIWKYEYDEKKMFFFRAIEFMMRMSVRLSTFFNLNTLNWKLNWQFQMNLHSQFKQFNHIFYVETGTHFVIVNFNGEMKSA